MLIAEDLAYGDMSLAIGALSSLAFVNTVIDAGTPAQQKALLAPFTEDGARLATIALVEPGLRFDPMKPKLRARKDGAGFILWREDDGAARRQRADVMLVIADAEGVGPAAFVVDKGQAGVSAAPEKFMGLRPLELSRVVFADVKVDASKMLDGSRLRSICVASSTSRASPGARWRSASAQAVLDYVIPYCNERKAFGEPITQSPGGRVHDRRHRDRARRHAPARSTRAASRAEHGLRVHARGRARARAVRARRA